MLLTLILRSLKIRKSVILASWTVITTQKDHWNKEVDGIRENTIVGVFKGVELLSFEALEEAEPPFALSNFLMTDAVNLLSSLMGVKFDMCSDLRGVLFFSTELNAGVLLLGVAKVSFCEETETVDLTGVEVSVTFKEETGGFFLPTDATFSFSELELCCITFRYSKNQPRK